MAFYLMAITFFIVITYFFNIKYKNILLFAYFGDQRNDKGSQSKYWFICNICFRVYVNLT